MIVETSRYQCGVCGAAWTFTAESEPSARKQFDAHRLTLKHYYGRGERTERQSAQEDK